MIKQPHFYRLVGKLPVPCRDVLEWAQWSQSYSRIVRQDQVGPLFVSTVFLGIDHQIFRGPPLLFETMIFDDLQDTYQTRCSTWDEAERMHEVALAEARDRYQRALESLGEKAR